MEQWGKETFLSYDGGVTLLIYSTDVSCNYAPSDYFGSSDFASITSTPPAYAELSALPIAQQGWLKIFDQWKENGIVV